MLQGIEEKRTALDGLEITCYKIPMNNNDVAFAQTLNNAKTINDLERLLQEALPKIQIDIDSNGQILICTGLYVGVGDKIIR
jgi:hypothetical protein